MVDFLAISNSLKVSVYVLGPYKPDFLFIFIEPPQKKKKKTSITYLKPLKETIMTLKTKIQ
jgi:hypothetical protein